MMYGVLKASEKAHEGGVNEVRLQGTLENEQIYHVIKFSSPAAVPSGTGEHVLLHQLSANNFIQGKQDDLDESHRLEQVYEEAKTYIISISKSANVASKFTSYVAVDEDSRQPVSGPLIKKTMPLLASMSTGYAFGSLTPFASMKCMSLPPISALGGLGGLGGGPPPPPIGRVPSSAMVGGLSSPLGALGGGPPPPPPGKALLNSTGIRWKGAGAASVTWQYNAASPPPPRPTGYAQSFSCLPPAHGSLLPKKKQAPTGALSVISLQKASGSWDFTDRLVSLCGASRDALIKGCPKEIAVDTGEGKLLWATALALALLMGKFLDQKDEWEIISEKGKKWLKKNVPSTITFAKMLESAAAAVGVQVNPGL